MDKIYSIVKEIGGEKKEVFYKPINGIIKENGADWIIGTTKDSDRSGDIVEPEGIINLKEWLINNPVMLYGHDHGAFPIGKYVNAIITNNDIRFSPIFADTEEGRKAKYLYDNKFLNSFSIGFIPKEWEPIGENGGRHFKRWELLEVSAVAVPANPKAIGVRKSFDDFFIAKSGEQKKNKAFKLYQFYTKEYKTTMDKIQLYKDLISKETDELKIKQYQAALEKEIADQAIQEEQKKFLAEKDAQEKVFKAKLEERELEIAKLKSEFGLPTSSIKVGVGDTYKGFRMQAQVKAFQNFDRTFKQYNTNLAPDAAKAIMESLKDEKMAEIMAKFWIDKLAIAHSNPITMMEKAMSEGTTTAGGYLTPDILRPELASYIREQSLALRFAQMLPMTSDVMYINRENAKVTVALTAENTDATESTPSFEQVTLTAKKITAYTEVSQELIQDSVTPIAATLLSQFVEAIGNYIDSTVFMGPGNPMSGVLKSSGYSQTFSTGSSNFSELLESDLRAIIAKLAVTEVNERCKWFMSHGVKWNTVMGLKDSYGRPLFIDSMSAGPNGRLLGFEALSGSQMPTTSAASTGFIYFGDLGGVTIGERLTNIDLMVNPYAKMIAQTVQYVLFTRWAFANRLPNKGGRIVTAA